MAPVYALDHFYLALTLLVTTGYQLSGFAIAWTFQFDKITDFTGGSNFFLLALLTLLLGNEFHTRNIVASVFVMVWAVRIAGWLLYRVLKTGSDARFDEIRSSFLKFLGFWIGQILWVWIVSLPVTILNSPAVSRTSNPPFGTSRDIAGVVMWTVGWLIETVADLQKFRFKNSTSGPKDKPIRSGLWCWSRHPPYFGEILCWWGIWILCLSPTTNGGLSSSAQYGAIVSPIFTVLILMFASGVPTAEKPQAKRYFLMSHGPNPSSDKAWPAYKEYLNETSHIPGFLKKTVLLDFPMYQFDEKTDGAAAVEAEATRS
ncbi:DUF1295-domain-containing protein [Mycena floridula]|nr:DUF1295-domain-containing protein [Mycena floridula]